MLSQSQRTTILELYAQGMSKREIARALKVSRLTVRKVLRSNSAAVPPLLRVERAEPYRQQMLELLPRCQGNLVRVWEELAASGLNLSYSALTAFCRRHGIGQPPEGRFDFLFTGPPLQAQCFVVVALGHEPLIQFPVIHFLRARSPRAPPSWTARRRRPPGSRRRCRASRHPGGSPRNARRRF